MTTRKTTLVPLRALLSGLLLTACGGVPEAGVAPAEESVGTAESALCSGLSVTSLTLAGISTYQGDMAGNGAWTVSTGANAVRLEYYVDGALRTSEDRAGASGTWYFSASGIACGTRNFVVKAFPMVVDSAGNRTTCLDSSQSTSRAVTEPCPAPTASLSCSRSTTTMIRCTGGASGGSGTYTANWQEWEYGYPYGWYTGTMIESFYCLAPTSTSSNFTKKVEFMVVDSNGTSSNIASRTLSCRNDPR